MPIIINGTTVTNNSINGTSISEETVNGITVYGGAVPKTKVWVVAYETSSYPTTDLGYYKSSTNDFWFWITEATIQWPPNNYAVGTTAAVGNGYDLHQVYQIQEV